MFTALGHVAVRRRRIIVGLSVVFVAVAAALGLGLFDRLAGGGFDDPASESSAAAELMSDTFKTGSPNLVLLVDTDSARATDATDPTKLVDAPTVEAAGTALVEQLKARPDVAEVVSYWALGKVAPLRSDAGTTALIVVRTTGQDDATEQVDAVAEAVTGDRGPITVTASGQGPVFSAISTTIQDDLASAEAIAVPLTVILLVIVFGGLIAAGLPLVVGMMSVMGTFLTLWIITQFTDVSIFSINLVTALGLGLAVDYSLFVVSRFREELAAGRDPHAAVVRTVETAGRTIAVSALTVGISLSALLVFPLYFLRSFAYAGIGVTLVSAAASLLTLPALLAMLGTRVDSLRVLKKRTPSPTHDGFWHRTAVFVMKRPVVIGGAVVVLLLFLGAPFLNVVFGTPDERVLPASNEARIATERLRGEFSSNEAQAFPVIAENASGGDAATDATAKQLSTIDSVARVDAATGRYIEGQLVLGPDPSLAGFRAPNGIGGEAVRFSVVTTINPNSPEGEAQLANVRGLQYPAGDVVVGGNSARLVDTKAAITARLPWAVGIIALATFILLFLMFGSVVVPLKAIVLNLLSLSATFGAMVWIFQEGHFSGLLGFTPTGLTDTTTPILMFCVAFGLSMDYEVFLLSRIKEEHDRTGDNTASVAIGLEKTGSIVTAAAMLLAITFLATGTSDVTFIKLFGIGLTLAVLMDATLVRGLLVPAFMKLAGEANWWAPRWMRPIHDCFGFSEHAPDPTDEDDAVAADRELVSASG